MNLALTVSRPSSTLHLIHLGVFAAVIFQRAHLTALTGAPTHRGRQGTLNPDHRAQIGDLPSGDTDARERLLTNALNRDDDYVNAGSNIINEKPASINPAPPSQRGAV